MLFLFSTEWVKNILFFLTKLNYLIRSKHKICKNIFDMKQRLIC